VEVVLNSDQVISVVVLSNDLAVEAMEDTAVHNVGIIVTVEVTSGGVERGRVLAEQLDLLLSGVTSLLDLLGSLLGTVGELLSLVLNFLVQTLEDGKDGALDALLGFDIGIDKGLGVGAHVLEETSNTAKALVEVVTFLQRVVDGLKRLLILLGVMAVDFLHSLHIFLDITDSMFPCLESLSEQTSSA
jgi:hypothetical protein